MAAPKPADLPFYKAVIAGGSAGVVEISIMYPTDIAKTRAQLATAGRQTMLGTLRDVVRNEGPLALYRGISSPIFAEAPKRATKFAANGLFQRLFTAKDGSMPFYAAGAAGAGAGAVEAFINCPFETVKVQMQAKENLNRFKNTADCLRYILREEGPLMLYRGIEAQVWRNMAWNGTYFACIGTVRSFFPAQPGDTRVKMYGKKFIAGLIGGMLGVLMNTPMDVAKSRMQNQRLDQPLKYRWMWPSLVTIAREEGFTALYKGLGPRIVRLGPGGGIMIVAFDLIASLID